MSPTYLTSGSMKSGTRRGIMFKNCINIIARDAPVGIWLDFWPNAVIQSFSQALLLKQFPLSLSVTAEYWFYMLLRYSIVDWDVIAKRLYRTFYTPQHIHLDARVWDEGIGNEAMLFPFKSSIGEPRRDDQRPPILNHSHPLGQETYT